MRTFLERLNSERSFYISNNGKSFQETGKKATLDNKRSNDLNEHNETNIEHDDVKSIYPGLENIVDQLIEANIPFDKEGNIDLTDKDGEVVASAAMLFRDKKIAIDPFDEESETEFKKHGYRIINSSNFDIKMLEE